MKTCTKCTQEKELIFFSKDKYKKDGRRSACKECNTIDHKRRYSINPDGERKRTTEYRANLRITNPEKLKLSNRNTKLKRAYNLSDSLVTEMKKEQNYCCFVCKKHEQDIKGKGLVVDHNHTTGKVRKLLCANCNTALGLLKEDVTIIEQLAEYVNAHRAVPA